MLHSSVQGLKFSQSCAAGLPFNTVLHRLVHGHPCFIGAYYLHLLGSKKSMLHGKRVFHVTLHIGDSQRWVGHPRKWKVTTEYRVYGRWRAVTDIWDGCPEDGHNGNRQWEGFLHSSGKWMRSTEDTVILPEHAVGFEVVHLSDVNIMYIEISVLKICVSDGIIFVVMKFHYTEIH
jgi:hypothetical protein